MSWPTAEDYNAAIQTPELCFSDPELNDAKPVCDSRGLPIPRSGGFASVYQLRGESRHAWAVKCFAKDAPGRMKRYAALHRQLPALKLPFLVNCQLLEQGIWVNEQWYPIVKMDWVEGRHLNEFTRDALDKPIVLERLFTIWTKIVAQLEQRKIVHGDFQHGNILVVPNSGTGRALVTLVDYDGMTFPGLDDAVSIDEFGHPAYQHPARLRDKKGNGPVC